MSNRKLTIDQLKNYLGTGLKCYGMGQFEDPYEEPAIPIEFTFTGIFTDANGDIHAEVYDKQGDQESIVIEGDLFPHCYLLSDLDKFIPELGFVPLEKLTPYAKNRFGQCEWEDLRDWTFQDMKKLFQWHFWVFEQSYFEAGLIIDKLQAGKEPSNV